MDQRADRGKQAVPGLQVRTLGNGSTNYRLRWRRGGVQEQLVFDAVDLRAARQRARGILEAVAAGVDPRPSRRRRGPLTVAGAVAAWVRASRRRWRRRTTKEYLGVVHRRLGDLRARPLRSVQRAELRKILADVAAKHPVEANRLLATMRALFAWLLRADQEHPGVTVDPTAGLTKPGGRERPRDVVLSDDELRRVMQADEFLAFIAHTGTREHETRMLTWDEVDLDRAEWRIPADGAEGGVARVVPLSSGALAILRRLRATYAERPWRRTRDQRRYTELGVRPHDVRRTVTNRIRQKSGEGMEHAVAGHTDARLTATYGPTPRLDALREALEWWSGELRRIAEKDTGTTS